MKQPELQPLCRQIFCKQRTYLRTGPEGLRRLVYASKYRKSDQARIFRKKVRTYAAAGCRI